MNLAHKIATHVTISRTTLPRDTLPRDVALDAYTYEGLAFDAVLEGLVPVTDPSVTPLFQLIFGRMLRRSIPIQAPSARKECCLIPRRKIMISQSGRELEEGVHITLEYNRDLFREETITGMTCSPLR